MAQTSVEWIESQLDFLDKYMSKDDILWFFNKAKEMHKDEIIEAYISGDNGYGPDNGIQESSAIDYYKETFNL